ncbi:MAG: sugar translocase [Candidatus Saccharibacteria bacterium]|jgi:putative flippase GtrA|nr:sugar translocase [Candidatus Saccharibacteria bacterium]
MINFKITPRKIRFSLVSIISTAIDFSILLTLTGLLHLPLIGANLISTSTSFTFSFFASKKFAFKTPNHHIKHEALKFIVVTLSGIWLLQPLLIWLLEPIILDFGIKGVLAIVIAKLIASLATFTWNYLFYTRLVFNKKK